MNFSGLTLDLDIEDPGIEELIEDFFPEKIGLYNYDIRNKAIVCYKDMISRSNRYETSPQEESQNSMKSFFTSTIESQHLILDGTTTLVMAAT